MKMQEMVPLGRSKAKADFIKETYLRKVRDSPKKGKACLFGVL